MARKRHSDEDILKLLREIEVHLSGGSDVGTACRAVGISDATYYAWRKKFRDIKTLQKFAAIHASIHNHFNLDRNLNHRDIFRQNRAAALAEWRQLAA